MSPKPWDTSAGPRGWHFLPGRQEGPDARRLYVVDRCAQAAITAIFWHQRDTNDGITVARVSGGRRRPVFTR